MALGHDEIVARSKRLNPLLPVNRYTGTLNDPLQEAQSRYMGPAWDEFFGGLAKTQEDAQDAGKSYRVGWGGFGNATSEESMPRTTRSLAAMRPDDPELADQIAGNQSLAAMSTDQGNRQLAIQDYADQKRQQAIDAMKKSYQEQVLASAVPQAPAPDITRTVDEAGNPKITMRPNPNETPAQRVDSLTPGAAYVASFGADELASRKQALAEKAQADAAEVAKAAAGLGPAEEFSAAPPDPKTANRVDPRTGLTPSALHQNAQVFALEGKLPSMGMGGKGPVTAARMAIQNKAGAIAQAAGVDLPTVQQEYKNNQAVLNNLMPKYKMLVSSADTANKNIQQALDQSANVPRTGSPMVNRFEQYALGHTLTGDPELTKLETYIYAAAREYAKVTGGSYMSAAELSNAGAKKAEELLNAAQTPQQFKAATEAMQADMGNVASPLLDQINQSSPNVARFLATVHGQNLPSGAPAPLAAAGPVPAPPAGGGKGGGPGGDVIYAKDPQGNIHAGKKGTALPQGWQSVSGPGGR